MPAAYVRQTLLVKETEREELLICTLDGEEIAHYALVHGHRQCVVVAEHYYGIFPDPRRWQAEKGKSPKAPGPVVSF